MGTLFWLASGLLAFFFARIIPLGRGRSWSPELASALAASLALGVVATALGFGGWRELDWRAGMFSFFGALAASGIVRALAVRRSSIPR
jgi:hypothetical protein